jgi:membrane dipeptidase
MMPPLDRRTFLTLSTAGAAAFAGLPGRLMGLLPGGGAEGSAPADAWSGYRGAVVIDALGGPGKATGINDTEPLDAAAIADVRTSGLTAVNVTLGSVGILSSAFEDTVKSIATWDSEIEAHPDVFLKVKSAADLKAAKASSRLGLIYGFQDTLSIGDDVSRLDAFYRLGVRIIQLTYNRRNLLGDGCLEPGNAGLSGLGRKVVSRMNELGMLVDLSHCGQRTTAEGIEASQKPVAITHSGCVSVNDVPRNKPDAILRALADKGGVVGIYLMPFLRAKGQPMAEDVMRHIDRAIQVCGEDHVGIGTDGTVSALDLTPAYVKQFHEDIANRRKLGISAPGESEDVYLYVPDLNTPRRFDTLAGMLSKRGYSDARIGKVLGGNFARLFAEVWR